MLCAQYVCPLISIELSRKTTDVKVSLSIVACNQYNIAIKSEVIYFIRIFGTGKKWIGTALDCLVCIQLSRFDVAGESDGFTHTITPPTAS